MKPMNVRDGQDFGLKEKVFERVGDWLVKIAVDTRECRIFPFYEPNLTPEMVMESIVEKQK